MERYQLLNMPHRQEGPFLLPPGRLAVDLGALRGGFATGASEWLLKQTELTTPVAEPKVVLNFFPKALHTSNHTNEKERNAKMDIPLDFIHLPIF